MMHESWLCSHTETDMTGAHREVEDVWELGEDIQHTSYDSKGNVCAHDTK